MDRDGTKIGFDTELTAAICDAVGVPVIASGGVGTVQHLVEGVTEGRADAVLAASIFHFGEHTVAEAEEAMTGAGITVRPVCPITSGGWAKRPRSPRSRCATPALPCGQYRRRNAGRPPWYRSDKRHVE